MILKKKIINTKYFIILKFFFKKIFYSLGILSFITIFIIVIYYFSSGLQRKFNPSELFLQINDKILKKYVGFDFRLIPDYVYIASLNLSKHLRSNDLPNFYLKINQKSIIGLELQRKIKKERYGPIPDEMKIWYPAKIQIKDKEYKVKIKLKGNRYIHWYDSKKTSYKIDLRGDDRIFKMEEFSLQKPITKNYTYEYLFHKLLGHVGLTNINYNFVNLHFNDQDLGVYAIEEAFSEDLLIRNDKKNGPIFSLKDELGEKFPNIFFELYSKNYWLENNPQLVNDLYIILNNIRDKNFHVNNYFDIDKWAKYFAIMDLTGSYHGSVLDSVKLYYNPETEKFEPIGYDLHKGAGIFDNFIISDLLDERREPQCSWICDHKELYLIFLKLKDGDLNPIFLEKYTSYLKEYSKDTFIDNFLNLNKDELKTFNNAIYQDNSKTDIVRWIGAGYFVYDKDYLQGRANLINSRINSINLNDIKVSKFKENLFYEDFLTSNFPVKGFIKNCKNKEEEKEYFFVGRMKTKINNTCATIELRDLNNNSVELKLKNNPELNF